MNKQAINNNLLSLLPGLTAALPSQLIQLATSLLTQSRSVAPSLKQDEEIARCYTCCHIACDRLKTRLDLPDIRPSPPCAKRTYTKVHSYLASALTGTSTPSKRPNEESASASTPTPVSSARQKRIALSTTRTSPSPSPALPPRPRGSLSSSSASARLAVHSPNPSAGRSRSRSKPQHQHQHQHQQRAAAPIAIPAHVMPLVRTLCRVAPACVAAAPHMYTGIETICAQVSAATWAAVIAEDVPLADAADTTTAATASIEENAEEDVVDILVMDALVVAVARVVRREVARMREGIGNAEEDDGDDDDEDSRDCTDLVAEIGVQGKERYAFARRLGVEVEQILARTAVRWKEHDENKKRGQIKWKDMDWFQNMIFVLRDKMSIHQPIDEADDILEDIQVVKRGGEMEMYSTDWASESKKKQQYMIWEKGIREKIRLMQK